MTVFPDPRSRPRRGSLLREGSRHIQRVGGGRNTGHGYHLGENSALWREKDALRLPHILIGASSSSRMGWPIKISLAFVHRYFISNSRSCTAFPGLFPRTETNVKRNKASLRRYIPSSNLSITESRSISLVGSAIVDRSRWREVLSGSRGRGTDYG